MARLVGQIYKITNSINGKIYVGKTMIGHDSRWSQHLSNVRRGLTHYLYRAMRKYGAENFYCEILESGITEEEIDIKETEWILRLKSSSANFGYNCTLGGDGHIHTESSKAKLKGVRKHSLESRAKMSAWQIGRKMSPNACENIGAAKRGIRHSPEVIAKRAATLKKRFAEKPWFIPKPSEEGRKRITEAVRIRMNDPAFKKAWSEERRRWWAEDPKAIEAKQKLRERVITPAARAARSARVWTDESREKCRQAAIRGHENRRKMLSQSSETV